MGTEEVETGESLDSLRQLAKLAYASTKQETTSKWEGGLAPKHSPSSTLELHHTHTHHTHKCTHMHTQTQREKKITFSY